VVFGLSLLGALACLDIYLQVAEIQTPMETRIDPELGPAYIPNKKVTRFNEGFFMGSVNEYGYMGPGRPRHRVGNEKRILLLGDSFVLGHTVLPRRHFSRFLESDLERLSGNEIQAMNFGKADFNVGNMYQYFHDYAGEFEHDLALFFVGEGDLVPTGQAVTSLYPGVRLEGKKIVIDKGFRTTGTYRFYKAIEPLMIHSSVLRLAFNTYKVIMSGSWRAVVLDKFAAWARKDHASATQEGPAQAQIPAINVAVLEELSKDPRNILVIQTSLDPETLQKVESIGMPIIDLGRFIEGQRALGIDLFYWPITGMSGHWNQAAQPLIGGFLAEQIERSGLLKAAN
jgi:hypothetical protein